MQVNLWAFLTVCVVMSLGFVMFVIYLGHKKAMKQLEMETLQRTHPERPAAPVSGEKQA